MRADTFARHAAFSLVLATLTALAGMTGCKKNPSSPPVSTIHRTLVVAHATEPRWVDAGDSLFLFSYKEGEGDAGLFAADLNGQVRPVYAGAFNHDAVPSPDGQRVAFSTPTLDGGLMVATLADGSLDSLLAGATSPAWIDNASLVAVDRLNRVVRIALDGTPPEILVDPGSQPIVTPDGTRLAYLHPSNGSGFELRYSHLDDTSSPAHVAFGVGTDIIWNPVRPVIYASIYSDTALSSVAEIALGSRDNITLLAPGTTRPSISRDGNHLYVDRMVQGQNAGILHINMQTMQEDVIGNAWQPAAASSGKKLLAVQDQGVYLITF